MNGEKREAMELLLANRFYLYSLLHKCFGREPDRQPVYKESVKPFIIQDSIVQVSKTLPPEAAAPVPQERPVPEFREVRKTEDIRPFTPDIPEKQPASVYTAPQFSAVKESAEQINTILPDIKKPMKVFGALFNTFILVEYEDQLLMVDQHAVHERLLFDKLMQEQRSQAGQELLVPVIISVTNAEQRLLEDNRDTLESIGLVVESFGERDIAVRTIPMILGETQTQDFIREVITELENGKEPTFEKKRTALLQTACKHAVKGGEALTEDELRSLLDTMIEKKVTPTCPHGRPLVVAITHYELDKKFKRIQK